MLLDTPKSHWTPRTVREAEENVGAHHNSKSVKQSRREKDEGRITRDCLGYVSASSSGSVSELEVEVDVEGPQRDGEDSAQGFYTWRQTLVKLRTLYPVGENYSGIGVPADSNEGDGGRGMYARLLEMRDTQQEVMRAKRIIGRGKRWKGQMGQFNLDSSAVTGERGRETSQIPSSYTGNLNGRMTL